MKTSWLTSRLDYDGSQLRSRFILEKFNITGDVFVAFRGSCDVPFENMVDGEDRMAKSEIRGADMLHFILEAANYNLLGVTALQRLLSSIAHDVVRALAKDKMLASNMRRTGDDLWVNDAKLSISVATVSPLSALIHFAVNVTNENTPVKTLSLTDLGIDPNMFAQTLLERFKKEFDGILAASQKVSPVN